jgi:outer membrane protein W
LLDQLAALQHTNGSIEIAFNVATGVAASEFRAGTIASVGLAGALFDKYAHSSRYLAMEERAAGYLLSLQGPTGLLRGGPDVAWYSTQHNLLAYTFLVGLGNELTANGQKSTATTYYNAAAKIAAGINSNLIVHGDESTAYFIEGLKDNAQALDADALGVMYLAITGQPTLAKQVLTYATSAFAVSGRSITLSSNPATFNLTYAASGPFSGFRPYIGSGAPNVLWSEGSAEMLVAQTMLGLPTAVLSQSLNAIANITKGQGPLQSDQTVTNVPFGVQYHVWPAAAAGAWLMLAQSKLTATLFWALG